MVLILIWIFIQAPHAKFEHEVIATLDRFHRAASQADGTEYFGCMTEEALFIGTDATETWNRKDFEAFCTPYFSQGKGWTYIPSQRRIAFNAQGDTAWFVEMLDNASYGICRGSGVLVKQGRDWKIAQYHLTIPIPNPLARDIVALIRAEGTPDPK